MSKIHQIVLFLCMAFSLVIASNAYSQGAAGWLINDVKIDTPLVDTPIYKVMNVQEKPWKPRKWIQIEVEFTTVIGRTENQSLDNVTVEYELLLPTEDPRNPYVLLSGKVSYVAFALDGGTHYLVAFVPPRIIEKFTMGKKLNNAEAKKFDVKIEFKMNDVLIGGGFSQPKGTPRQGCRSRGRRMQSSDRIRLPGPI
ncbi:MAG: hypothetical protein NT118_00075 [Lentisphaerae bacterium]|nr:hypothetical protein [Lentisphaerota bacterium]